MRRLRWAENSSPFVFLGGSARPAPHSHTLRNQNSFPRANRTAKARPARGQPTLREGFTLLEAVVAIALFTIALAEILNLQGRSINDAFTARQYNTVAKLARNKMVELETQLRGKVFTEVQAEQAGTFPDPDQDYRWEAKIKELEFPDLGAILGGGGENAEQNPGPAGQNMFASQVGKSVSTFLSKSLRLVQLTIFWKRGSKEQEFSISTYWVDLVNELSI